MVIEENIFFDRLFLIGRPILSLPLEVLRSGLALRSHLSSLIEGSTAFAQSSMDGAQFSQPELHGTFSILLWPGSSHMPVLRFFSKYQQIRALT